MSTEDIIKKKFTREQLDWIANSAIPAQGSTMEEKLADMAKQLFKAGIYSTVKEKQDLSDIAKGGKLSYDLNSLAQVAGFSQSGTGDKAVSPGQQFYEAYFGGEKDKTERDLWRVRIKTAYGDDGWEKAKKVLQGTINANTARAIEKGGEKVFEDTPGHQVVELFRPRFAQAVKERRDPTAREQLMDLGQNLLYAAPVGGINAGIARAVPGVAGKVLGAFGSNAVAPVAVSTLDYALGTKDYAGPTDALIDAGLGTATNLGINRVLAPMISAAVNAGMVRGSVPQWLRNFLEGTKSEREAARDLIAEAENKIKRHYGESNSQYIAKRAAGKQPDRLTDEQLKAYTDILNARDMLGEDDAVSAVSERIKVLKASEKALDRYNPAHDIKKPLREQDDWYAVQKGMKTPEQYVDYVMPGGRIAGNKYGDIADFVGAKGGRMEEAASRAMKAHPELISLFEQRTVKDRLTDPGMYFDMAKSWGVNEAGDDNAAQAFLSRFGVNPRDLRDVQEGRRKKKDVARDSAKVLDMAKGDGLTEQDRMWLSKIAAKPDIVSGMGEGNSTAFRNWYLLRGQNLLRDTKYFRATPDVEDVWTK